jgi:hypothetical protein
MRGHPTPPSDILELQISISAQCRGTVVTAKNELVGILLTVKYQMGLTWTRTRAEADLLSDDNYIDFSDHVHRTPYTLEFLDDDHVISPPLYSIPFWPLDSLSPP